MRERLKETRFIKKTTGLMLREVKFQQSKEIQRARSVLEKGSKKNEQCYAQETLVTQTKFNKRTNYSMLREKTNPRIQKLNI
jgi:hypothetical protein